MCGPHHCLGRDAFAPNSEKLCGLLQRREDGSVSKQRCAGLSAGSAIRRHKFTRPLGRTSSPLRSGLSFRYTHGGGAPVVTRSAAAERMRLHRERKKNGMRCVMIELRETEIEALIQKQLLNPEI